MIEKKAPAVIPDELYIPPEALVILLDEFSGPLDLLLYLIRKQNLDILNIPIVPITNQYMTYLTLMQEKNLDLSADYLLMAATLAEIKSRMLLPVPDDIEEEDDPRHHLVRRIQQYEQMKIGAENLELQPRCERDFFLVAVPLVSDDAKHLLPTVSLDSLCEAMSKLSENMRISQHHAVLRETFSVRERMQIVLEYLQQKPTIQFHAILQTSEGKAGTVAYFLAILELGKLALLTIEQHAAFTPITLHRIQP